MTNPPIKKYTRMIDGKKFYYFDDYKDKSKARSVAKRLREYKKLNVRITKAKHAYVLWKNKW